MATSNQAGPTKALYLDDLHVGQRFTSDTHLIDEEQIKVFAKQFDPQPFHLVCRRLHTRSSRHHATQQHSLADILATLTKPPRDPCPPPHPPPINCAGRPPLP